MAAVEEIVLKVSTDVGDLEGTMRQLEDFKNLTDSIRAGPASPLSKPLKEIIESALEEYFDGAQPGKAPTISIPESFVKDVTLIKSLAERISLQYQNVVGVLGKGEPARGLMSMKMHANLSPQDLAMAWRDEIMKMDEDRIRAFAADYKYLTEDAPVDELRAGALQAVMKFLLTAMSGTRGSDAERALGSMLEKNPSGHLPSRLSEDANVMTQLFRIRYSTPENVQQAELKKMLMDVLNMDPKLDKFEVQREALIRPIAATVERGKTVPEFPDPSVLTKKNEKEVAKDALSILALLGITKDTLPTAMYGFPVKMKSTSPLKKMRDSDTPVEANLGGGAQFMTKALGLMYTDEGELTEAGKEARGVLQQIYPATTTRYADVSTTLIPLDRLEGDTPEEKIRWFVEQLEERGLHIRGEQGDDEAKKEEFIQTQLTRIDENTGMYSFETLELKIVGRVAALLTDMFKQGLISQEHPMVVAQEIKQDTVDTVYAAMEKANKTGFIFQQSDERQRLDDDQVENIIDGFNTIVENDKFSQLLTEAFTRKIIDPAIRKFTDAMRSLLADVKEGALNELLEKLGDSDVNDNPGE